MLDSPTSTPSENRLLLWLTLLPILALITVLAMNLGLSLFRILSDPEFLRGYGVLVSEITMVSIIGWVLGVGAGALISRSQPLTESVMRFLRLGMWLPFFVFGNLTHWGDIMVWNINIHARPILAVVIAASPPTILASCYYYLCFNRLAGSGKVQKRFQLIRAIVFHALPVCLVWQLFSAFVVRPWPWGWLVGWTDYPAAPYAFGILVGLFVLVMSVASSSTFDRTAVIRGRILSDEIAGGKAPFLGVILILAVCLALWLAFNQSLKQTFLFSTPAEVLKAEYQLFVTGMRGMQIAVYNGQTGWRNVGISLVEILAGIGLAAGAGFGVLKALEKNPSATKSIWSHLLCLTYIVTPIVLWQILFPLLGIGIWHKILLIGFMTFFPVVQIFWIFREAPMLVRALLAIDEALPLAFVGMILGELWAATAGIEFFIVMSRSMKNFAESTAMSLFGFGVFAVMSFALRSIVNGLSSRQRLSAYLHPVTR